MRNYGFAYGRKCFGILLVVLLAWCALSGMVPRPAVGWDVQVAKTGRLEDDSTVGVQAITLGGHHSCALTDLGEVWCWGQNGNGRLGDGTIINRTSPVAVVGLGGPVSIVSAGGYHTCALTNAGGLFCWGRNVRGQLGDGTGWDQTTPVTVSGLDRDVLSVSAGGYHTCAIIASGGVKCWGRNDYGQLGDGTFIRRLAPVDVKGLDGKVVAVSCGSLHTCALTAEGRVKCWGRNTFGQLGDGTRTNRNYPVDVLDLDQAVASVVSGGHHTCALTDLEGVKCWGHNWYGQLGDGTTKRRYEPIDVEGLDSGVVFIATGGLHSCAITESGDVSCWGNNDYWQIGEDEAVLQLVPVEVKGLDENPAGGAAGGFHNCIITQAGGVQCWGQNLYGQLGDGSKARQSGPVDVVGF